MQLGFVSAILPDLTLEEVLDVAARYRYSCVEMMCWPVSRATRRYAGVTHIDVTEFSEASAKVVQELLARTGIEISALGYYPNPLSPDPAEAAIAVEHIKKMIRAAAMLGLECVNTFAGRDKTRTVEDNWERFLETWRPAIDYAEEYGIKVGIENCPMLFTTDEWPGGNNLMISPAIWRRAFADIPSSHFGLNFDPSHFVWQQMDYIRAIAEFGSRFVHVHAKDVIVDQVRLDDVGHLAYPNDYHTPKLPGLGDVDWDIFFDALRAVGYDGPVCVEVEDRAYEETLERRLEALEMSANFLAPFIQE